jgi:post-segregation antitoxin (ccd killing protein)
MAKKRKISLSIDSDLLQRAETKGVDLDDALENALRRYGCEDPVIADARAAKWREENRAATEQSNRHIEKYGLWWEGLASNKKSKSPEKKTVRRP